MCLHPSGVFLAPHHLELVAGIDFGAQGDLRVKAKQHIAGRTLLQVVLVAPLFYFTFALRCCRFVLLANCKGKALIAYLF